MGAIVQANIKAIVGSDIEHAFANRIFADNVDEAQHRLGHTRADEFLK